MSRATSVVIVNTGDGKGKSSSAFGVMIRGVARGWRVAVVQSMKSGTWMIKHAYQRGIRAKKGIEY